MTLKSFLLITASLPLLMASCGNKDKKAADSETSAPAQAPQKVEYLVAAPYFVKNGVEDGDKTVKITSQAEFDEFFGPAATMGEGGMPTPIDFSSQFVIAVINRISDRTVEIMPVSLTQKGKDLILEYMVKSEPRGGDFLSRAALILIVDGSYAGYKTVFVEKLEF